MSSNFAFCRVSIAPLRKSAADASEMVSQLLFGELVTLLKRENNWLLIETILDCYEGWIDEKQIFYVSENEMNQWKSDQQIITKTIKINSPIGKMSLPMGAFISSSSPKKFQIGTHWFESNYGSTKVHLISFAKTYLNTPYLWGGKSNVGIDCSGFSQIVYRSQGIELPRDASQQVHLGNPINRKQAKAGDLAFFTNDAGKVIHVGILLSKSKIIHASGRVKIDKLNDTGIWSEELNKYSHNLYLIKRFL